MHLFFLLNLKSDAIVFIQQLFTMMYTQSSVLIKSARSDNGSEYFNCECAWFFQECGMVHQSSYVHTPQQNGVV